MIIIFHMYVINKKNIQSTKIENDQQINTSDHPITYHRTSTFTNLSLSIDLLFPLLLYRLITLAIQSMLYFVVVSLYLLLIIVALCSFIIDPKNISYYYPLINIRNHQSHRTFLSSL